MQQLLPNLELDDSLMFRASERFCEAFHKTWSLIPADDRQTLNDFLAKCPGHVRLCYAMDLQTLPEEPWGRCSRCGEEMVFTFLAPFIERASPIEAVSAVIAHEFAHCLNHARGTWTNDDEIEERNARETNAGWGFVEPARGDDGWKQAIEGWRKARRLEFGAATERSLFDPSPAIPN